MVCSIVCSGTYQRKHQSSASLAFVMRIHRWQVNSPHKGPVTREMFPFNDVIMISQTMWRMFHCCVSNPSGAETRIVDNKANTVGVDALEARGSTSSTAMVLNIYGPCLLWRMIVTACGISVFINLETCKNIFMIIWTQSTRQGFNSGNAQSC